MKIDLGCGSYPRGDIGVTMHIDGVVCEATKHPVSYTHLTLPTILRV